ncbi:hypothetical protein RhiirA5_433913 [Rhizophagus irregularis]|uniref:Uncharacterized protein n=1 Tax=Rhizophagus irregularis TaxID=588596 RepID=A0A2I1FF36_9GLOM|nr:hypothetical protein RhiirA5_433913 [Rhizophagus irregularis]PKC57530.1 hypothetical protein RhiirA1_472351 [Rhizophagus irregularis]PKY32976.1 hypothetical protein RhiirB3_451549 [Rhizophagus irregularis]
MIRIVEERVENFIGTWIVNIEEVTLEGLKNSICEMNLKLPALENDGVVLNFTYEVLTSERSRLQQNALAVHIEEQFQLYELGESDNPSLSVFSPFTCEYKDLENDSS